MNADGRASHPCSDLQLFGRVRDRPDDAPDKGTLPLPIDPGMIMIRDHRKLETRFLRAYREANQIGGAVFFAAELVADFGHYFFPPFLPPLRLDFLFPFFPRPLP